MDVQIKQVVGKRCTCVGGKLNESHLFYPAAFLKLYLSLRFALLVNSHVHSKTLFLGHQLGKVDREAVGVVKTPRDFTCDLIKLKFCSQ